MFDILQVESMSFWRFSGGWLELISYLSLSGLPDRSRVTSGGGNTLEDLISLTLTD